jgi:hypothetical protein
MGDCFVGKNKSPPRNDIVTISALTNPSRPAILTLIKLTLTVAMSAVCFENNRNVARTFPSRISWQGSFFMPIKNYAS